MDGQMTEEAVTLRQIAAARSELERMATVVRELGRRRDALNKDRAVELSEVRGLIDEISTERDNLRSSVEELTQERDELRARLDPVRERDELRSCIDRLTRERDELQARVEMVTGDLDELVARVGVANRENDALRSRADADTRELNNLRSHADAMRLRVDQVTCERDEAERRCYALTESNHDLKLSHIRLQSRCEILTRELEDSRKHAQEGWRWFHEAANSKKKERGPIVTPTIGRRAATFVHIAARVAEQVVPDELRSNVHDVATSAARVADEHDDESVLETAINEVVRMAAKWSPEGSPEKAAGAQSSARGPRPSREPARTRMDDSYRTVAAPQRAFTPASPSPTRRADTSSETIEERLDRELLTSLETVVDNAFAEAKAGAARRAARRGQVEGVVVPVAEGAVRVRVLEGRSVDAPGIGRCIIKGRRVEAARLELDAMALLLPRTGPGTNAARDLLARFASLRPDERISGTLSAVRNQLTLKIGLPTLENALRRLAALTRGVRHDPISSCWTINPKRLDMLRTDNAPTLIFEFERNKR
ncbi:MAG: hypothetical protein H6729_00085 [Deltaproteobacteria bacterium]|nr:hypothetical protein [Deltaproteobacteria bacterium]